MAPGFRIGALQDCRRRVRVCCQQGEGTLPFPSALPLSCCQAKFASRGALSSRFVLHWNEGMKGMKLFRTSDFVFFCAFCLPRTFFQFRSSTAPPIHFFPLTGNAAPYPTVDPAVGIWMHHQRLSCPTPPRMTQWQRHSRRLASPRTLCTLWCGAVLCVRSAGNARCVYLCVRVFTGIGLTTDNAFDIATGSRILCNLQTKPSEGERRISSSFAFLRCHQSLCLPSLL